MKQKNYITPFLKSLAFAITLAILLPSVIKLFHFFNCDLHHCDKLNWYDDNSSSQITDLDKNCKILKLKFKIDYHPSILLIKKINRVFEVKNDVVKPSLITLNNKTKVALRAPPFV